MKKRFKFVFLTFLLCSSAAVAQSQKINDSSTPLHLSQPAYDTPYGIPKTDEIVKVIDRIYNYLEIATPAQLIDNVSKSNIQDFNAINSATSFKQGDFRLISYEWGVTYAGMLLSTKATGDQKYAEYTFKRMEFLADIRPYFLKLEKQQPESRHAMYSVFHPHALDDAGAMCAAMIKSEQAGFKGDLNPMIDNFIDYISNKQFRFEDATFARNRPQLNSLWLDDLFMSVPALAQMGKYTGNNKYFDDAVKQVLQFSKRMFNYEKGLYMHGWVLNMDQHPQFHWARANGWAIMTMVELLEVLPDNYAGRDQVLDLLKLHIRGLANYQSPQGFWHQLIDRNDSYLETSATAIFVYCIAHAINKHWIDPLAYGPVALLGWNAVSTQVTPEGFVKGTCVGTGMGFDPAYYYYRPVNVYAAHGYGPVLLAGAEIIELLKNSYPKMNDSAVQFYRQKVNTDAAIFNANMDMK
jgi:unsaturated rhamnogalacturonyl hydrolase